MAKPDNPEDYIAFEVDDDVIAYVSRELLDRQKPGTWRIRFYIGGYGGYWLEFDKPWQGPEIADRGQ
jgi:hypothetical protein